MMAKFFSFMRIVAIFSFGEINVSAQSHHSRGNHITQFSEEYISVTGYRDCQVYIIMKQMENWNDASAYCNELNETLNINAQLAIFGSIDVFDELRAHLSGNSQLKNPAGSGYWVGCNDQDTEDHFKWLNGSSVGSQFWALGQPDDSRRNQDCCLMWEKKRNDEFFNLDDGTCTDTNSFICQIDTGKSTPFNITATEDTRLVSICRNDSNDVMIIDEGRGKAKKCLTEIFVDDAGLINWPLTNIDQMRQRNCPYGAIGKFKATRKCVPTHVGAKWEEPDTSRCLPAREASRGNQLNNLANHTFIPPGQAKKVSEQLNNLTAESESLDEDEINLAVDVVGNILDSEENGTDIEVAENVLRTVNDMLNTNPDVLKASQRQNNAAVRLIKAVERLSAIVQLGNQSETTIETTDIKMTVAKINSTSFNGLKFGASSMKGIVSRNLTSTAVEQQSSIELPTSLFSGFDPTKQNLITRAQFVSYRSNRFFKAVDNTSSIGDSDVIAASIGDLEIRNLKEPVKIVLPHKGQVNSTGNISCVFWDFKFNDGNGGWSSEGCTVSESTVQENVTVCECNHLTNFALLVDVYDEGDQVDSVSQKALSIISYIGCGISLLALVVTIVTLVFFKKRKDKSTKILLNLCCALFMVLVMFLIGSFFVDFAPIIPEVCTAIAVLLHYFLLAVLAWMVLEAIQMYLLLVKVFKTYYTHFMVKFSLIGWGIPLVIVVITIAVDVDSYGHYNTMCWLSRYAFLGAFLAPMCLVLVFNTVIFCLVIYQICGLNSKALTANERFTITAQLRAAIGFMVLLGLTWILAIFAIGDASLVFQYLFAIFNSLQGLFIFIFHCAMKKEIQSEWRKTFCRRKRDKYKSSTDTNNLYGSSSSAVRYTVSTTHETDVKIESSIASTDQGYHGNGNELHEEENSNETRH
ncbi:adhesion G-protein coupled receptor G6-like [Glandiceps talaboti]